ncbi:hypothetical protein ACLI1A_06560 [Flavobacterium sp. RHBU_3]|uniref:hypothetical protein n=1 Tax=Flavobacterium sp. RHBU_3 TaxID=3391184 RepID=UPI0039853077
MSTAEIKLEIEKVLDTIPEDTLSSVLEYLKGVAVAKKEDVLFSENLRKIIEEDSELLHKLAQ